jgi:hypothetical protein
MRRDLSQLDGYRFTRAIAHRSPWNEQVEFMLFRHEHSQPRRVAMPIQFVDVPDDSIGAPGIPTFRLEGMEAQELMDMLWDCGLRPTQAKASAGQTEAVMRHLEDMRALAFSTLEIAKP